LEFLNENTIKLIMLFVAPGFISMKVWGLIHPSEKVKITNSLIEAIIFGGAYYIFVSWFTSMVCLSDIFLVPLLFVLSIICPIFLKLILGFNIIKDKTISTIPKSWDYFFSNQKVRFFVLIHLKNERIIGGLYGGDSFASSYPEKEDLYLEEVWRLNEEGIFMEKTPDTKGLLINYDEIEYIELFNEQKGESDEREKISN